MTASSSLPEWDVPEGAPQGAAAHTGDDQDGRGDTFVVQEHHARSLHWDVRLERDGVLVSWAVPKGLPLDPADDHLAKQTSDHPMAWGEFEGEVPAGEYGAGAVTVWDRGTYELLRWREDRVDVVLHGLRAQGRWIFYRTGSGDDWRVHRMDGPPEGWSPLPTGLRPMAACAGPLPPDDDRWSYEVKWDGVRVLVAVEGGRVRLTSRNGNDVTAAYPEVRGLGAVLGSRQALLDGEVVALRDGRPDFGLLQSRMHVSRPSAALVRATPVTLLLFDLLHLEGRSLLDASYDDRRAVLEELGLDGPSWSIPPAFPGTGRAVLEATRAQGMEGVVAKRRDSRYQPGRRSDCWVKVKHVQRQTTVIAGWKPGEGGRAGRVGSLLLGVHGDGGLEYAGHVGTGFTSATLRVLSERLEPLRRETSPYDGPVPREHARTAVWVEPRLVCDVDHTAWTSDGRLRHPSFKGLRDDLDPRDAVRDLTARES
ncbi:MAG TPA: non-homologous end-joining DNA ligase [Mycobacteriales bacterium]|nr:non-homologous end-joining DNA ligase [Mycobacteriales bacterium]